MPPAPKRKPRRRPPPLGFPTLGWRVIEWAEEYLCHGPGDVQGTPLELPTEACVFLMFAYEIRPDDGRRVIRRAALSRPKGWAKTELAAIIACAELCGPVRFDHWRADGEAAGRPVVAPRVRCYATEEVQATGTYEAAAYMLEHGRAFAEYRLDVGIGRTFLAGGGELSPRVSAPTSAEGGKDTFAVFDETHLFDTERLRQLHNVVRRNLGKRAEHAEPWSLETSTMYRPGDNSVAETLHRYWMQLEAGEYGEPEKAKDAAGILFDHREGPQVDLDDDKALERALRHAYGDSASFIDFARVIAEIRDPQTDEADNRRYWLNQPVRGDDAWLDEQDLDAYDELAAELEVPKGEAIVLGFDGSLSDDATVLIGCTLARDSAPYLWPLGIWAAPENPRERDEWVVDRDDVNAAVADAFERYQVALAYCDPAYWTPELAAWASEFGADVVREFPTNRDYRMGPAQDALRVAVVAGEIQHDGDPVMRQHFANARRRRTRHGVCIRKDRPTSPRKIDAAVGAALAFAARNDALAANLDRRRKRVPGQLITF